MKKQISNLGKTLSKKAQQQINGGGASPICMNKRAGDSCESSNGIKGTCQLPHPYAGYLRCY